MKLLNRELGDRMVFGAGTVTNAEMVHMAKAGGAQFIISPDTDPAVIKATVEAGLVSIPGALTPTDIASAQRAGADFIKLFPVGNMGADYVKAVRAPLSNVRMLAVGGIDLNNIAEYRSVGIQGFGIGSSIVRRDMIESGDFEGICELAKKYVEAVR